ncbi:hypothetical protein C8J57DRAFT_72006 [Mycena rebaudengoi]|nr:hypothetical protein C8J57DRAFT_72006 [Mycena rebaudengoi]
MNFLRPTSSAVDFTINMGAVLVLIYGFLPHHLMSMRLYTFGAVTMIIILLAVPFIRRHRLHAALKLRIQNNVLVMPGGLVPDVEVQDEGSGTAGQEDEHAQDAIPDTPVMPGLLVFSDVQEEDSWATADEGEQSDTDTDPPTPKFKSSSTSPALIPLAPVLPSPVLVTLAAPASPVTSPPASPSLPCTPVFATPEITCASTPRAKPHFQPSPQSQVPRTVEIARHVLQMGVGGVASDAEMRVLEKWACGGATHDLPSNDSAGAHVPEGYYEMGLESPTDDDLSMTEEGKESRPGEKTTMWRGSRWGV